MPGAAHSRRRSVAGKCSIAGTGCPVPGHALKSLKPWPSVVSLDAGLCQSRTRRNLKSEEIRAVRRITRWSRPCCLGVHRAPRARYSCRGTGSLICRGVRHHDPSRAFDHRSRARLHHRGNHVSLRGARNRARAAGGAGICARSPAFGRDRWGSSDECACREALAHGSAAAARTHPVPSHARAARMPAPVGTRRTRSSRAGRDVVQDRFTRSRLLTTRVP